MNLRHLRYFLAICEEQSFCQAATRCGIAQPSLTNAIKRLEEKMGGSLFTRRPKACPTPLALSIKPFFERVVLDVRRAELVASRVVSKRNGAPRSRGNGIKNPKRLSMSRTEQRAF
jgi:LysR family hydrogen peroxide-inducible transcriptional activator